MKNTSKPAWSQVICVVVFALVGLAALCTNAEAQTGNNAVYNSSGNCSACASSPTFIDATVFVTSPPPISQTFCGVLNYVLVHIVQPTYPFGAVIDARGLNSNNTSMTCTSTNPSPWSGITSLPPPSTILLPRTTASNPIVIPSTWSLPPNTHLIGEGGSVSSSTTVGTTIQAKSGSFSGSMIQFGWGALCLGPGSSPICSGMSAEDLILDGQGQAITGILNQYSGDQTYVDHVSLYQIVGTGLSISNAATNSGPYSNITFDTGGFSGVSSTICAAITDAASTHGIHGLSCTSESEDLDAAAAVLLDSSNNSIEDVRISGFYDGIRVGANANAQSNVLVNIIGDTSYAGSLTPINIVHIFNVGNTVSDLSIMGANNAGGSPLTVTIQDDLTGPQLKDTSVGIYAIGNKGTGDYYSRFTTSPNAATWVVANPTNSSAPSGNCSPGSLYSNLSASAVNTTFYVCAYNTPANTWKPIK